MFFIAHIILACRKKPVFQPVFFEGVFCLSLGGSFAKMGGEKKMSEKPQNSLFFGHFKVAEDEGLEPPSRYRQRFSRPSDYHYPNPPRYLINYSNIK